jgi:ABC-type nitrate/sulfonate/bicarbonate transport system ATPase subunit/ABC-type nitrate/sulfonate/bicarbonate transport system permease component
VETLDASPVVLRATVSRDYGGPVGSVLQNFSIECRAGEILAIVGSSGCGKSTLLHSLAESESIHKRSSAPALGSQYAFAFQEPELIPWRDVSGNARFEVELTETLNVTGATRAQEVLHLVGLSDAACFFPHELSTGMRQRLQLARVIARAAPIVFLDEPLAAVDQPSRLSIARNLRERFKATNSAVVWVTHDLLEALTVADRVLAVGDRPLHVIREINVTPSERPQSFAEARNTRTNGALETLLKALEKEPEVNIEIATQGSSEMRPSSPLSINAAPRWRIYMIQSLLLLTLIGVWEFLIFVRPQLGFFLPAPHDWLLGLVRRLVATDLLRHAWVTLREALTGLSIGFAAGTLVGYMGEISDDTGRAMRPLWVGLTAIPLFVLAPAFIIWFGIGESMKAALAACSAAPFAALAILDGVETSHGRFFHYLKANGVRRVRLFSRFVFPHTLASWFLGLRSGAVAALLGAFLGEFISANRGLGYLIVLDAGRYRLANVIGDVLLLFFIAVSLDSILKWVGKHRHQILYLLKV